MPKQQSPAPPAIQRVAIYIRVSSDEQAKFGDSIRDQKETGLNYISTRKTTVLQGIYIDDGISGQKLERGDFQKLMDNVTAGAIDLIVFTKLDRWFRNLRHYLNTQSTLEANRVSWLAIDQPYFDTSTPYGRAFVAQSMTWAELEAQNGGIRIKDVFKSKIAHGEVVSGKVPRGYRIENKRMVFSEEAPVMLDIFNYFRRTQSMSKTITYMEKEYGIVMTVNNLRQSVLRNEKYTGCFRDNENFCPRIVPDDVFSDIQRLLDARQNIKSGQKYPYIFSGLLICDECGYKMGGCHINVLARRKSGQEYRYKYPAYECKQYRAHHRCINGGEIRELRIEEYLLEHIREEMQSFIADYGTNQKPVIDNRNKKNSIIKKLEKIKTLYLNDIISLEEYKDDRQHLTNQLNAIPDIVQPDTDIANLEAFLASDFESIYSTFDNHEKRLFWRSIIKEIRVSKSEKRHREYKLIFL